MEKSENNQGEHGEVYAAWADLIGADEAASNDFNDYYLGQYANVEEYAEELLEHFGLMEMLDKLVPQGFRPYVMIDTEGLARDLQLGGDIDVLKASDGGVWLFRPL